MQRNVARLLNQRLLKVDSKGEVVSSWDLSEIDLKRPTPSPPPTLTRRSLKVSPSERGFILSLEGFEYQQEITLPDGVTLISHDVDSDLVILLDSEGNEHAVLVADLDDLLFRAAIMAYPLGKAPTVQEDLPPTSVRFVKRRLVSPDKSRVGRESRLDLNPNTRRNLAVTADRNESVESRQGSVR